MIYVGTSGFGYHEWSPAFYPAGMCYEDYLSHYADRFACCELSATFFRMPSTGESERLLAKVPSAFRFTAKLHRGLTHERGTDLRAARTFADALAPLSEGERLGAVLAQFPFSFVNNPYNRAYLCRLRAALELPLVVELRNETWLMPETIAFLEGWGVGLAAIDAPVLGGFMPRVARATSRVGYVRFHGRNPHSWWRRRSSDRYDYRYRQRALVSWLPRVREIAKGSEHVFVIFNNHRHGHAVTNAVAMLKLLERKRGKSATARTARAG